MSYTLIKEYVLMDGRHEVARAYEDEGLEIACEHEDIKYGEDDERGECQICGAECDWCWQLDEHGGKQVWVRFPHEWHFEKEGLLQKLIKQEKEEEYESKKHQTAGENGGTAVGSSGR